MKSTRFVFSALIIASMFLSLLAAPLSGSHVVKAEFDGVPAPILVSPSGNITTTLPEYKWHPVAGATKYQLVVTHGASTVYSLTFTSLVCSGLFCTVTPTTPLAYTNYTWKVRAVVAGVWGPYSTLKNFVVVGGFNSTFASNSTGWSGVFGTWTLVTSSPGYYKSYGATNYWASAMYNGTYSKLDYTVVMKTVGCSDCENYVIIRGTPAPLNETWKIWNKGYYFIYNNSGSFMVTKYNGTTYTPLKTWASNPYIFFTGWNTIRVTANGTALRFYINGHQVWAGTDPEFTSGKVGFGFHKTTPSGPYMVVDSAVLSTVISTSSGE